MEILYRPRQTIHSAPCSYVVVVQFSIVVASLGEERDGLYASFAVVCLGQIKQDTQKGNNRSPDEPLAQDIDIIRNSKRPLVELLKLLELN